MPALFGQPDHREGVVVVVMPGDPVSRAPLQVVATEYDELERMDAATSGLIAVVIGIVLGGGNERHQVGA